MLLRVSEKPPEEKKPHPIIKDLQLRVPGDLDLF